MKSPLVLALIAGLLSSFSSNACVDTRSGNFCAHYDDIVQKSAKNELKLTRVYNSASPKNGWFGHGWSTTFETYLRVMPDGTAVVRDPASRQIDRYTPPTMNDLRSGVERIVAAATEKDGLDLASAAALRSKLLASEEFRQASVSKYGVETRLPAGTRLRSAECGNAAVVSTKAGYRRTTCSRRIDFFDRAGRLVMQEEDSHKIHIHYDGDRPDRIEDSAGHRLHLKWTAAGRIAEAAKGSDGPQWTYLYDDEDNLVFAGESGGEAYRYRYAADHKLTQVDYPDRTHKDMHYDESGLIASVTDIDGSKVAYAYRRDPAYPSLHYWVTSTSSDTDGMQRVQEGEYFFSRDVSGIERLARAIKTEGSKIEHIALDHRERILSTHKSDGSYAEFTYHPVLGKVAVLSTHEGRTEYGYDKSGNLISAKNGDGRLVRLSYDRHNRISRMVERNRAARTRRELTFRYNADNQPVRIAMAGKGEILVEYDPDGEISNVESKQGARMALEVTAAFQSLLMLVKAVGVNVCL